MCGVFVHVGSGRNKLFKIEADFNQSLPFSPHLLISVLIPFFLRLVICIKCRNKHNASVKEMPRVSLESTDMQRRKHVILAPM